MTTRRVTASMLYAQSAPVRWVINMTSGIDQAAAGVCRAYWQRGRSLDPQPVRVPPSSRRPR
jgi:hypothetical protein